MIYPSERNFSQVISWSSFWYCSCLEKKEKHKSPNLVSMRTICFNSYGIISIKFSYTNNMSYKSLVPYLVFFFHSCSLYVYLDSTQFHTFENLNSLIIFDPCIAVSQRKSTRIPNRPLIYNIMVVDMSACPPPRFLARGCVILLFYPQCLAYCLVHLGCLVTVSRNH